MKISMEKSDWIYLIIILILLALGSYGWYRYLTLDSTLSNVDEVLKIEEVGKDHREQIDSLQEVIKGLDSDIKEKKLQENRIDTLWRIEKENITYLPLDASVLLLKQNLEDYENEKDGR